MDVNRYYVPPKPKKDDAQQQEEKHKAATSRFKFNQTVTRLPTPQAFFERQRQFKAQDKQAMLRFAKKKVVKHNLKMRRKELKRQQQEQMDELRSKMRKNTLIKAEETAEKVELPETEEDVENHEGVELNKLKAALHENDEHEINRNVLINFFELKDPDRVAEVDDLLAANKGREAEFFDKITKDYKVVRETGRSKARESLEVTARTPAKIQKPTSSFVEGNIEEAGEVNKNPRRTTRISNRTASFFQGKGMKKIPSAGTLMEGSVASIDSILSVSSDVEGVKEFQDALDKEIKAKKYHGEYVTSIKERGGQWWVNQAPPKVHPSQRRRNTLLDDLRNGNVPLSL